VNVPRGLVFAVSVLVSTTSGSVPAVLAQADTTTGLSISTTAAGLGIDWIAPAALIDLQPGGTSRITIPGFQSLRQSGAPAVPYSAALVTIPPGAQPLLQIQQIDEKELILPAPVERAGKPKGVLRAEDGQIIGGAYAPAAEITPYDSPPLVLEPIGVLRGVQLARLVFYPARPQGSNLRLTTRVRASLSFINRLASSPPAIASPDLLLEALKAAVVNPQDVQASPHSMPVPKKKPAVSGGASPTAAVEVDQTGLTEITSAPASSPPVVAASPKSCQANSSLAPESSR